MPISFRFIALFICIFAMTSASMAQHALSGSIKGLGEKTVYLYAYTGLKTQLVDSSELSPDGHFVFDGSLGSGMYMLRSGEDFDLELLYDGNPVQFVMTDAGNLKSIQFMGSPLNEKWSAYVTERTAYRHAMELLRPTLRQYDPQTEYYRNTAIEYTRVQSDFRSFTDSLIAKGHDYASRLIAADREMPVNLNQTADAQRSAMIDGFFNEVDFNDTTLIPTNVLTTKMVDYLTLFQGLPKLGGNVEMGFIMALGNILEKAKVNMRMYEFVLEYMLEGFTAMGQNQVTNYLLNYPRLEEGEVNQAEGHRLDSIAAPYQKVRVGAKAPQISGTTIDGKAYDLYASKAKFVIVFFWATDCDYCHDFLVSIRKNLDLKNDFDMVTFAIADDKTDVKKSLKKLRLPGYHFYDDQRWNGKAFQDYHVTSTPTAFVLDEHRNIVLKPYDWRELEAWLKK